jgi:hypothetical protein
LGSQKRPSHETSFIKSHFPADTLGKAHGVTLEGARDHADAMLVDGETVPVFAEPDGQR